MTIYEAFEQLRGGSISIEDAKKLVYFTDLKAGAQFTDRGCDIVYTKPADYVNYGTLPNRGERYPFTDDLVFPVTV